MREIERSACSSVDSVSPPHSHQQATTRSEVNAKHLKFKQYDPMSFVVVILNFLREDTAPLLAPSFDRSVDHPSPAPKAGGGSVPGERWRAGSGNIVGKYLHKTTERPRIDAFRLLSQDKALTRM